MSFPVKLFVHSLLGDFNLISTLILEEGAEFRASARLEHSGLHDRHYLGKGLATKRLNAGVGITRALRRSHQALARYSVHCRKCFDCRERGSRLIGVASVRFRTPSTAGGHECRFAKLLIEVKPFLMSHYILAKDMQIALMGIAQTHRLGKQNDQLVRGSPQRA
jgi:hypothetical protein